MINLIYVQKLDVKSMLKVSKSDSFTILNNLMDFPRILGPGR